MGFAMTFDNFKKVVNISKKEISMQIWKTNSSVVKVKKKEKVVENLTIIFDAALKVSKVKGFQAMSVRDLSAKANLSIGAIYSYISNKEELFHLLQMPSKQIAKTMLMHQIALEEGPANKLRSAVQMCIYLSEIMRPWFYFTYSEVMNRTEEEKKKTIGSELHTGKIFRDILCEGSKQKVFKKGNTNLTASIIESMLQDWCLKRGKYRKMEINIDEYTEFVIGLIESYVFDKVRGD